MIKYLQLPFYFDVKRLQHDVSLLDALQWKLHYQKLHYQGEWSGIPLRSVNGNEKDLIVSPLENQEYKDTSFLQQGSYLQELLYAFKCPLKTVRLLKLNAGAIIKEHTDAELFFEKGEARIHIPIVTDDAVEFYTDTERIFMRAGECWYVNFNLPHSIINNSQVNRIHLVIDVVVNDWIKDIFTGPAVINKKEVAEKDPYDDAVKKEMIKRFRAMNTVKSNELADDLEKKLHS